MRNWLHEELKARLRAAPLAHFGTMQNEHASTTVKDRRP
jgi:hypothetical protein